MHPAELRPGPGPRTGALWGMVWTAIPEGVGRRLQAGGAALEIGCGRGLACIALAEHYPAAKVTGYDSDPQAIAQATLLAGVCGLAPRVRFVVADSMRLPRATFDFVAVWEMLVQAPDPRRLLNAIRNALVPDGVCLSFDTSAGTGFRALARSAGFSRCRPHPEEGRPRLFELCR
jgi:SAM-dependent methyltransferase